MSLDPTVELFLVVVVFLCFIFQLPVAPARLMKRVCEAATVRKHAALSTLDESISKSIDQ